MSGSAAKESAREPQKPPYGSFFYIVAGESHSLDEGFLMPECEKLTSKQVKKLPADILCDKKWAKTMAGMRALRCHTKKRDLYYYFFAKKKQCIEDRESALSGEP